MFGVCEQEWLRKCIISEGFFFLWSQNKVSFGKQYWGKQYLILFRLQTHKKTLCLYVHVYVCTYVCMYLLILSIYPSVHPSVIILPVLEFTYTIFELKKGIILFPRKKKWLWFSSLVWQIGLVLPILLYGGHFP